MTPDTVAAWMLAQVEREGCIYQDDVVDHLVKAKREDLLTENADGNQAMRIVKADAQKLAGRGKNLAQIPAFKFPAYFRDFI